MTAPDDDLLVVLCTVPDEAAAARLARLIVERRLAACVNRVGGLTSVFWWQGAIQEDPEHLLIIKTRRGLWDELVSVLSDAHPYDVPEIVALPVEACHEPYACWLRGSTTR